MTIKLITTLTTAAILLLGGFAFGLQCGIKYQENRSVTYQDLVDIGHAHYAPDTGHFTIIPQIDIVTVYPLGPEIDPKDYGL